MDFTIFDIEANGLLHQQREKSDNKQSLSVDENGLLQQYKPVATKIHCLVAYKFVNGEMTVHRFTDYNEMRWFLLGETVLVGHNIKRYDIPMIEKFLHITLNHVFLIDTLALSWYLYPALKEHGLEAWGETFDVPKPPVEDWENDTIDVYLHRCEEDVKINTRLFQKQFKYLLEIYEDFDNALRFVRYLTFKMDCAKEQEEEMWRLDIPKCKANLAKLIEEEEVKVKTLASLMPKVIKYQKYERPKTLRKKDGSLSVVGQNWLAKLEALGLPEYTVGPIKYPVGEEEPNPGSHQQLKDWLFSLGWQPQHFKPSSSDATKQVPQISNKDGNDVCESIKDLYETTPELEVLEGLFIIRHRKGLLKGFLENVDSNGYLKAQVSGLTNTLRFKHTVLVNLPQIPKPYWEEVRGCLITDEGYELCGSDMSSLEDNTKQHYMYYFDPEYVMEMRVPGFDPHLDIAMLAGMLTKEQADAHKLYDSTKGAEGVSYKAVRLKAKKVNFSGIYGAGAPKIADAAGISLKEAKQLHTTYWKRNKAVKQVSNSVITKHDSSGNMWLFNPVSRFWYSLRTEKDKFSTLNQGTGVYCFDTWLRYVRAQGVKLVAQFHDEKVSRIPLGTREEHTAKLKKAIDLTNAELNLNVPLAISIDYGNSYAQIH